MTEEELVEKVTMIISLVGTAKSQYMQAVSEAKKDNFIKADELIKKGQIIYAEGHHIHADFLTNEAQGKKTA